MKIPHVSIIISNYNYAHFLHKAIDSSLSQSYPNIEVVVVDDGSTDNSREVISKYGCQIISVLQENGKQAAALNKGFEISQGFIVIFLDADDYLFPTAVERIVESWNPEISKIHYRLEVVDAEENPLGFSYPQGQKPLASGQVWKTLLREGSYQRTPMSGNALSRNALNKVFPIPDKYKLTADDYLCILLPFYGKVAAIEDPLGAYRIHGSNQWALTTVTVDRFRRFVQHDLQNYDLLVSKAKELGHEVLEDLDQRSIGRIWSRIISLKLDPGNHPVKTDTVLNLTYQGIRSLWKYSPFTVMKRIVYTLWFLWVGFLPLPLAKLAITWLYAPHMRPSVISKIAKRLKALPI
ncbi:glycosyltransferase [Romeria aff. gracilis LEGE 07310]|uniref:Glycosyltransferase n=1 Tax=Vasconcelosia minhoensis LEGE 07310 TaxID=915328 RepID=A0A8J7DEW8_9CYAN|nr:glycosyltransferase [Romeria gracilis]MBE9080138.1 glycosyltransferase [Romeria aff. gracilis LEGE 07310]